MSIVTKDTVRVLRVLEYVGPRDAVEEMLSRSIQGQQRFWNDTVIVKAATLGTFPEILQPARVKLEEGEEPK